MNSLYPLMARMCPEEFARAMEKQLQEKVIKDWRAMSFDDLYDLLLDKVCALQEVLYYYKIGEIDNDSGLVLERAAAVANSAMMIADVSRVMDIPKYHE